MTELLKQARTGKEWVFRFAGDEFIVLGRGASPADMAAYMEAVNAHLRTYNDDPAHPCRVLLSYGMSGCEKGDIDAFLKNMDDNM